MGTPPPIESVPVIRPKIGVSTQVIYQYKWYKNVENLGVDTLEINRRNSKLYLNRYFLDKVRRYLQGFHLSLHSATTGIFQELESFTRAELEILMAEVDICRFLGARELVFHLDQERLSRSTRDRLKRVLSHAESQDVEMLYESDNPIVADTVHDIFNAISGNRVCPRSRTSQHRLGKEMFLGADSMPSSLELKSGPSMSMPTTTTGAPMNTWD